MHPDSMRKVSEDKIFSAFFTKSVLLAFVLSAR